ncbi:hypothetical protein [Paenilisteria rocourtiae]|uniref:Uncharacterized protein n=1 Tax=Listeria rocourtiae TaxID=647910 RepID=A0A4V3DPZ2_9LIST|nr:hypothetical protein [Listeria rocourtiae]EUJ51814.1 hypothetical protein PROCOU_01547 [Listeria rocourtiae FSL F6-920]TDR54206.1 hypothetical protein DFP96_103307 [Listeria rocourtiae]
MAKGISGEDFNKADDANKAKLVQVVSDWSIINGWNKDSLHEMIKWLVQEKKVLDMLGYEKFVLGAKKKESDRNFMIQALSKSENKPITFYEDMEDEEIETRYEAIVINEATDYSK